MVSQDAHINVKIVASKDILKYLYKYMNKGGNRTDTLVEDNVTALGEICILNMVAPMR